MHHIAHVGAMTPVISFADLTERVQQSLVPWNAANGVHPQPVSLRITQALLSDPAMTAENLQNLATANGLTVVGLSAVGIGDGSKQHVHTPDWRTEERLALMFAAANLAADIARPGEAFSITTTALSYGEWIDATMPGNWAALTLNVIRVVQHLVGIYERTGITIHLDFELEPGSLLRNATDAERFFTTWLLGRGAAMLSDRMAIVHGTAAEAVLQHVRIALDTAHAAVVGDTAADVLDRFAATAVQIGRLQISAALQIDVPADTTLRHDVEMHLRALVSDRLLQQVVAVRDGAGVQQYSDLPAALAGIGTAAGERWRIHTHAPLLADRYGVYRSTRDATADWLREVAGRGLDVGLIELRSANWAVVPADDRASEAAMIAREFAWVKEQLGQAES